MLSNAVFDLATNPSLASLKIAVTEFADVVDPFVLGASLDYDSGNNFKYFGANRCHTRERY